MRTWRGAEKKKRAEGGWRSAAATAAQECGWPGPRPHLGGKVILDVGLEVLSQPVCVAGVVEQDDFVNKLRRTAVEDAPDLGRKGKGR